jgi:hypothetical protein
MVLKLKIDKNFNYFTISSHFSIKQTTHKFNAPNHYTTQHENVSIEKLKKISMIFYLLLLFFLIGSNFWKSWPVEVKNNKKNLLHFDIIFLI